MVEDLDSAGACAACIVRNVTGFATGCSCSGVSDVCCRPVSTRRWIAGYTSATNGGVEVGHLRARLPIAGRGPLWTTGTVSPYPLKLAFGAMSRCRAPVGAPR